MSDFAHRLPLDRVRDGERIDLTASDAECAEIARRLGLLGLDRLEAHAALSCDGPAIRVEGRVKARLTQACVATGEPVPGHVDEPFAVTFLPEPRGDRDEEIELGSADLDTMFHDGQGIELGQAVVDSLALALDPYPRSANADEALKAAGVIGEDEAGPFAALAALKDKLAKGG